MKNERKKPFVSIALLSILLFFGCGTKPSFYLVIDDGLELANLAGQWEGEFTSSVPGRHGSIFITITAQQDTAYGQVVLSWYHSCLPFLSVESSATTDKWLNTTQLLTIKEIYLENGIIGGNIEPYPNYECGCLVTTRFNGRVSKDTIKGTFVSEIKKIWQNYTGEWKVTRKKPT